MGKDSTPSSTTTTTTHKLNPQANELWNMAKPTVTGMFDKPYQAYQGNKVAGFNGLHQSALNAAGMPSSMPMDAGASRGFLNSMLSSQGLGAQVPDNPLLGQRVGSNPFIGQQIGSNPMLGIKTGVQSNPLLAENNPYFESSLKNTLNDVTDQFQRNKIAQTDANFARHNLFGGSNWADAQRQNQRELAQSLGGISTNARMNDYNNRMQLHEADINRRLQADQNDITRNSGLYESALGRDQSKLAQDASLYEAALGRDSSALNRDAALAQHKIDLSNQNANTYRTQQMQAASILPNISQLETADAANRYNLLSSAGKLQQGQDQAMLDDAYQRFMEKQGYDKQRADYLRDWLSTLNGGGSTTASQSGGNGGGSPFAKLAGSAATGLGTYASLAGISAAAPFAVPAGLLIGGLGMLS